MSNTGSACQNRECNHRESAESLGSIYINRIEDDCDDLDVLDGTPSALIVSNVAQQVFLGDNAKESFEALFHSYDSSANFLYLKSFCRARIEFSNAKAATRARAQLNNHELLGCRLKMYYAQMPDSPGSKPKSHFLEVPKPQKQFLISPPASPPVGWEQVREAEPTLNHDLLNALASLAPGAKHELHEPCSSAHPAIVLHIPSSEPSPEKAVSSGPRVMSGSGPNVTSKIQQTKCPPRAN